MKFKVAGRMVELEAGESMKFKLLAEWPGQEREVQMFFPTREMMLEGERVLKERVEQLPEEVRAQARIRKIETKDVEIP